MASLNEEISPEEEKQQQQQQLELQRKQQQQQKEQYQKLPIIESKEKNNNWNRVGFYSATTVIKDDFTMGEFKSKSFHDKKKPVRLLDDVVVRHRRQTMKKMNDNNIRDVMRLSQKKVDRKTDRECESKERLKKKEEDSMRPKELLFWRKRNVKTFPNIKEPDMKNETPEMTALRRLRSRLRAYFGHPIYQQVVCLTDQNLLSWLSACNMDIFNTEARLLHHYFTRYKLGTITKPDYKPPEILTTYYTGGICGMDRDHCPVWYELLGSQDMTNLVTAVPLKEMVKFKFHQFEKIKQAATNAGVSNALMIVDMQQTPIKNFGPAIEIWTQFIKILQEHYPYLFKEIIILNIPQAWTEFGLALRPYLNRQTRSKIFIIRNDCLKHLLHRIERHNIPAYLGGYKCDLDNNPYCTEQLNWQGKLPLWMHRSDHCNANVKPFVIPGGERLVSEIPVTSSGSHVFWDVLNINQSVTISIYLDRTEEACLMTRKKIEPDPDKVKGQVVGITNVAAGRYFMVIDNWANYASAAKGRYILTIQLPVWLSSKGAQKKPLGECFRLDTFIGEEERMVLRWKYDREPHFTWKQDQVSP